MKLLWSVRVSLLTLLDGSYARNEVGKLMSRHLKGDPHAFRLLLEPVRGDLWGFLYNHIGGKQDAEDLFQEICLKVYRNLAKLQDPSKFRSWLFAIAMNSVRSFYRKRQLVAVDSPTLEALAPKDEPENPSPQKSLEVSQSMDHLRKCLAQLPERDRQILLLEVMGDLPQKEIASQFDLNLNTVKTVLRRARIKLARMMAEMEGNHEPRST